MLISVPFLSPYCVGRSLPLWGWSLHVITGKSRSSKPKEPLPDSSFLVVNDIIYATMGVTNTLTLFTPVTNIAYEYSVGFS